MQRIFYLLRTKTGLVTGALGLIATLTYFNHFIRPQIISENAQVALVIYLALFFSVLIYLFLFRYTLPSLQQYSRPMVTAGVIVTFLIALALVLFLPIRIPAPLTHHHLTITATGQRNTNAKASQVWVIGLYRGDGSLVKPDEFALNGMWTPLNNIPTVSIDQQPASFQWTGLLNQDAHIEFVSHPWSGIVQIDWDGQKQTVDLFANVAELSSKRILLSVPPPPQLWLVHRLFQAADVLMLGLLMFIGATWIFNKLYPSISAQYAFARSISIGQDRFVVKGYLYRTYQMWLVAVGLGSALALWCVNHLVHDRISTRMSEISAFIVLTLFCALICYMSLRWLITPYLMQSSYRIIIAWVGVALVIAGLLLVIVHDSVPGGWAPHQLEIKAQILRDPSAQASEIWVLGLSHHNGTSIPLNKLLLDGSWTLRDGVPFSFQTSPGILRWNDSTNDDILLKLRTHPWSGMAEIEWDGSKQILNLYSADSGTLTVILPNRSIITRPEQWSLRSTVGFVADFISLIFALLVASIWFKRVFRPFYAAPEGQQPSWFQFLFSHRRIHWGLFPIIALAATIVTPTLTNVFFDGNWITNRPLPRDYLLVWIYTVFVFTTLWYLLLYRPEKQTSLQITRVSAPWLYRFSQSIAHQTLGAWLVALVVAMLAAGIVIKQTNLGGEQSAFWLKLSVDTPDGKPPTTQVRYGPNQNDVLKISQWQPYASTDISLRPLNNTILPINILAVTTDQGPLPLHQITAVQGTLDAKGIMVNDPQGTFLSWPQNSRALTLTLAPGKGSVEAFFLDQRTTINLDSKPVQISLRLPTTTQGWVLLPPKQIAQLAIEFPQGVLTTHIHEVELLSNRPQHWSRATNVQQWTAQGCLLQLTDTDISLVGNVSMPCTMPLPGLQEFNTRNQIIVLCSWFALTFLILIALWLLILLTRFDQWFSHYYPDRKNRFGHWLEESSQRLSLTWMLVLVLISALFVQSVYLRTLSMAYISDTIDYFGAGLAFAQTHRFAAMYTIRTPGLPILISMVIDLFGPSIYSIAIVQHILVALLAPLTVWSLTQRLSLIVATLAGLLIVVAPVANVYANYIGTEPVFTACTGATLLLFIARGSNIRGMIVTGFLAGLSVMVRPNGVVLLTILFGWILLEGWCAIGKSHYQRLALLRCVALAVGYMIVAGPWHMYLAVGRDTLDLSQGLASFSSWAAGVYEHRIDGELPINLPERALWSAPYAWHNDPYEFAEYRPAQLGALVQAAPYYTATTREELHLYPDRWLDNFKAALIYNIFFVKTDPHYFYFEEVRGLTYNIESHTPVPLVLGNNATEIFVNQQVNEQRPLSSSWSRWSLEASRFVLTHWQWVAILALCSGFVLLIIPRLRIFMPIILFWLALIFSTSVLGMPVERYIIIVEPMLYAMIVVALFAVVSRSYRHTSTVILPSHSGLV